MIVYILEGIIAVFLIAFYTGIYLTFRQILILTNKPNKQSDKYLDESDRDFREMQNRSEYNR